MKKEKTEIKPLGIVQGVYDIIEIVPFTTKRERYYDEIVSALKAGKFFVMREGYNRNGIYLLLRKLKEKSNVNAVFGQTQTGTNPETKKPILQYALFVKKD